MVSGIMLLKVLSMYVIVEVVVVSEVVVGDHLAEVVVDGVDVDAKPPMCIKTAICVKLRKKNNKGVITLFLRTFYAN